MPENFFSMNVILPPPQQYEIARLNNFKSIEKLLDFMLEQCNMEEALQIFLPVHKLNSFIDVTHTKQIITKSNVKLYFITIDRCTVKKW